MHTGIQTPFGSGDDASGLNLSYTLLPEHLKQRHNYTNYMIGKWHLGMKTKNYLPSSRGFDKYFGYYLGCTDYWKHYGDLNDGGNIAVDLHEGGVGLGLPAGEDRPLYNTSGEYSTSLYANVASDWISKHDQKQPMFMYFAFQGAHSANNKFVQAPKDLIARFDESISPNATCGQWELPNEGNCTKVAMRKTVAATVVAIDDAVAVVESALRDAGMLENTLIVFSSDNGGPTDGTNNNMMSNFPLRSGKGETFEGGIRAVGLISGAGIDPKVRGTKFDGLLHVSDWLKTLVDVASEGRGPPLQLKPNERPFIDGDGISAYASLFRGSTEKHPRNEIFIAAQAEGSQLSAEAIRIGDMKLITYPPLLYNRPGWYPPPGKEWNYASFTVKCGPFPDVASVDDCMNDWCLFNLTSDPCEYTNVAKKHPNLVASMKARLAQLKRTTVLTWVNFSEKDPTRSDPTRFGPTTPIVPDPQGTDGPHVYQGVWEPWLTNEEELKKYPSAYRGPGY